MIWITKDSGGQGFGTKISQQESQIRLLRRSLTEYGYCVTGQDDDAAHHGIGDEGSIAGSL